MSSVGGVVDEVVESLVGKASSDFLSGGLKRKGRETEISKEERCRRAFLPFVSTHLDGLGTLEIHLEDVNTLQSCDSLRGCLGSDESDDDVGRIGGESLDQLSSDS